MTSDANEAREQAIADYIARHPISRPNVLAAAGRIDLRLSRRTAWNRVVRRRPSFSAACVGATSTRYRVADYRWQAKASNKPHNKMGKSSLNQPQAKLQKPCKTRPASNLRGTADLGCSGNRRPAGWPRACWGSATRRSIAGSRREIFGSSPQLRVASRCRCRRSSICTSPWRLIARAAIADTSWPPRWSVTA
jgi:hypothetical protein